MKMLLLILLSYNTLTFAETNPSRHYETAAYQTHLLELYTSEGCSSCPPAEAWLANIKPAELKRLAIIPLAFHVTYWDYIGWKDVFSKKQFDQRQRKMVTEEGGRTVYTPQFFIDSSTKRGIASAIERLAKAEKTPARIKIKADLTETTKTLNLQLTLKALSAKLDQVLRVNIAIYENAIKSAIQAGENEGRVSQHQYVARELKTALISLNDSNNREFVFNKSKNNWSGLVIFVESGNKVIEALDIAL